MSRIIIPIVFILEIFLAASPHIEWTAGAWGEGNPADFYSTLATFVGIQFTLLTAAFAAVFYNESKEFRSTVNNLILRAQGTIVRRLRDDHFYEDFLAAARSAKSLVRISYFAPYPPSETRDPKRNRYYKDVLKLMSTSSIVRFKRLVRDSPKNAEWIAGLIRDLEGKSTIDLAILRHDVAPAYEMPLALSVQIVDDDKVWLVAVAAHERQQDYRDVHVENKEVADAMIAYYTRLWNMSEELLRAGVLTSHGEAYLEALAQQ